MNVEQIARIAWATNELKMPVEEIGAVVYQIGAWMDGAGNRGYDLTQLAAAGLNVAVLDQAYKLAWDDILFYAEANNRKRHDFNGWGVRRQPRQWWMAWTLRYGVDNPIAQTLIESAWGDALVEHEKRKVQRKRDICLGVNMEKTTTKEIAQVAASMGLLEKWASYQAMTHWMAERDMWAIRVNLYREAFDAFTHELIYRTDRKPAERGSQKKNDAALADWATAKGYLYSPRQTFNLEMFYSEAYIKAACQSPVAPDVSIDFDDLPRRTVAETPIVKLKDADLVASFMAWAAGPEDEFAVEDRDAILRALRKMYARAKGQHGTVDAVIGEESE